MRQTCDLEPTMAVRANGFDDLADLCATVDDLRESLLDYNPLLAVMADALRKAMELELEACRFSAFPLRDRV